MAEQATESKYSEKSKSGRQMYGPGCCAHTVTPSQIANAKANAWERADWRAHQRRPANFGENDNG